MTNDTEHKAPMTMGEIVEDEGGVQDEQPNLPALIASAVSNPNIDADKLDKLLDINIKMMDRQAEIEFNQAMARLQPTLPEIEKATKGHNNKYAKYEHIERIIRPLYTAQGFSMSFTSKLEGDVETYFGTLSHSGGHSITGQLTLPPDTSGSKNAIQAKGSTISYARRYILCMLLNIVTIDEDDDGALSNPIGEERIDWLKKKMDATDTDEKTFIEWAGYKEIEDITDRDYNRLKQALIAKEKAMKNANN